MRSRSLLWRVPFFAVGVLLIASCGVNTQFVYKPGTPSVGGAKLPVKVAVLSFKDGTEDFTERGNPFTGDGYKYNLAKSGISDLISALTPPLWAKAFADDMTASGGFQTVRFIYSTSELVDEDFYIEGTLKKAYVYSTTPSRPNEFALGLRAVRRADSRQVWEKEVKSEWMNPRTLAEECKHAGSNTTGCTWNVDINKVMQSMFAEARADLVRTLASLGKGRSVEDGQDKETSTPQDPDSVERTIDRILKGK